jgi:hypothetical protein
MNTALPLKIGKIALKTGVNVLKFSFKIAWAVFLDDERDRRIKANREWLDNYDEYAEAITKRK